VPGLPATPAPAPKENRSSTRPSKTIRLSAIHAKINTTTIVETRQDELPTETKSEAKDFTAEQLKAAWQRFAETKKAYLAEYLLLTQPYELRGTTVIVPLHHPVQETLLHNLRSDLAAFLRTQLDNQSIQVMGEMRTIEEKAMLYTNREKFEFMANKNPALKELKDRLGLDTDF